MRSAYSARAETSAATEEIIAQLGDGEVRAVVFFAAHTHDGEAIGRALRARFGGAEVVGCTTAGEFTAAGYSTGGVAALALGPREVRRAAAAMARLDEGAPAGVTAATARIAAAMDVDLRAADPKRYVGVVLVEGLRMREEAVNEALGNAAPLLSFVGGSAGDGGEFRVTRVFCNGEASSDGAALLLLDAAVPFFVGKSCSFAPTTRRFTVTRADPTQRVVYELDGRPVVQAYAEAAGVAPGALDTRVFMVKPLGLVIDGQPWIRSPQQLLPDGGLRFYCQIAEGIEVTLMESTDLIGDTRAAVAHARASLGGSLSGGLVFNCILRRLEIDARALERPFTESFAGLTIAGFHTYGESWLAHINQTLTALWFA